MTSAGKSLAVLLFASLTALAACGGDDPGGEGWADDRQDAAFAAALAPEIESLLAEEAPEGSGDGEVHEAVTGLYAGREHRPIWVDRGGPTPRGRALAAELLRASRHGLDTGAYRAGELVGELGTNGREARGDDDVAPAAAARLDLALSRAFARLARDLGSGRVAPATAGIHWQTKRPEIDLAAALSTAAAGEGPAAALAAVRPPHEQYAQLEKALAHYRRIAAGGGWPAIPAGDALEPGAEDPPRVVALRRRLAAEGYATAGAEALDRPQDPLSPVYDEALAVAVREYQRRRSLTDDGIVGGKTLDELNVSAAERVRQIEANLERWRWVPADLGARYVLVNVPRFELEVHEGGREVMRMRVVVGEELNATPMFSDQMQYLVFNPYWNVPASIVGEEILPALERDSEYLARQQMEVVQGWERDAAVLGPYAFDAARQAADDGSGYRIRQRPGTENPLGQIKFMFPNEHAIYLHDTSAVHLFDETVRTFSHGCIRIEQPVELASWVLGEPTEAIRERVAGGEDQWVEVPRPIPVHILYFTVGVDEEGKVLFFDDFYGIDERVLTAVAGSGPAPAARRGAA